MVGFFQNFNGTEIATTPYPKYLGYCSRILFGSSTRSFPDVDTKNSRIQTLASFKGKNNDLIDCTALHRYTLTFLEDHIAGITEREFMLFNNGLLDRIVTGMEEGSAGFEDKVARAKFITRKSNAQRNDYYMEREFSTTRRYRSVYVPESLGQN